VRGRPGGAVSSLMQSEPRMLFRLAVKDEEDKRGHWLIRYRVSRAVCPDTEVRENEGLEGELSKTRKLGEEARGTRDHDM